MTKAASHKDFETILQLLQHFDSEQKCIDYLAQQRWGGKPVCPHCQHDAVYTLKGENKRYKCAKCRKQFTVRVGTIFEDSKLPLRTWFLAIYLCCNSSKGVSSHSLAKQLGITQKSAWHVLHRVREMLKEDAPAMLEGEVEADETYVGGREENKHRSKRTKGAEGRSIKTKAPVFGLVERGGRVIAQAVPDVKSRMIQPVMRKNVKVGAVLYTDEFGAYKGLGKLYTHEVINHSGGEYVRGSAHTNTAEGFWSLLKRGINGIYHRVSTEHLNSYVQEYAYRYNTRSLAQQERLGDVVRRAKGKHLPYRKLTGKDQPKG